MKRSPSSSRSVRTGAAQRLREEEAVVEQRGGVELHELEVGERCARAVREEQPFADRAARVCRSLPQGGVAAGGEDDRLPRERGDATSTRSPRDDADARVLAARAQRAPRRCGGRSRRRPRARRGCGSGRPRGRGPRRTPRRGRRASAIRAGASRVRSSTALSRQRPRPAASVSAACSEGSSSGADRRGDAALRGPAVRGVDGALREDEDRCARVGGGQRGGEAGDSGTDDREVGMQFLPQRR